MKIKFTWGHAVIAILGAFIVFILSLIFTAGDTGSLITEDYYNKELVYQDEINAQQNAKNLTEKPKITTQANGILIEFSKEFKSLSNGRVILKKYSDDMSDLDLTIQLNRNHTFLIPAAKLKPGEYLMELYWQHNQKEYLIKNQSYLWKTP